MSNIQSKITRHAKQDKGKNQLIKTEPEIIRDNGGSS